MSWLIVVVMSWLKIFFKNALGFTDGLNGQFLIAHWRRASMQLNCSFNSEPLELFLFWNRSPANFIHFTLGASPTGVHTPVPGVGSIPSRHRSVKAAINLYNAGGDRGRPRLEFHIADHRWTGFYLRIAFPVPPRGRLLPNVKINATMLHERLSAPPTEAALHPNARTSPTTTKISAPATATPRQTSPMMRSGWNLVCVLRKAHLRRDCLVLK
jgi:hypothetical protein